jgi:hypothetical protein
MKKTIIQLGLLVVIIILTVLIVQGIMNPINFNKEKTKRYAEVVNRLKDIREVQLEYRSKNSKFCGNIDSLKYFMKNDSVEIVRKIGDIEDTLAVARGEVVWDTVRIAVIEKLKRDGKLSEKFNPDSLIFIPFSGGQKFNLGAGKVMTGSKVEIEVFEASATNKQILIGLDDQLRINLDDESKKRTGFPGLRVGSLTEANNNAGNWEK